jgi:hypothetical protein
MQLDMQLGHATEPIGHLEMQLNWCEPDGFMQKPVTQEL